MGQLEQSVQQDGWIGAITVAADGETFDGSARIEVAAAAGFEDAIIVESDGTRPVVHVRTDIPSADDLRAVRLGIAANRVASVNLEWDADTLAALGEEIDLSQFWTRDELEDIALDAQIAAEIEAGLSGQVSHDRKLGDTTKQIKPVLYADEIEVFEQALRATGKRNRGEALITVCRAYIGAYDGSAG